jgi:hypothetical protein
MGMNGISESGSIESKLVVGLTAATSPNSTLRQRPQPLALRVAHAAQSVTISPGTRSNSLELAVMSGARARRACAAISTS